MTSELKDLKKQERQIKSTFDGVRKFLDQFKAEKHAAQIATRLEMLETAMKKFYTVQRKMEIVLEEEDEEAKESPEQRCERQQKRDDASAVLTCFFEDTYCELKASLKALLPLETDITPPQPTTLPSNLPGTNSRVKLPEIRLPSFGGLTREWVTFRDTFRSLIHLNDQLSTMDKFTYLRSSLTGDAFQEIASVDVTAANYSVAWDLLQKRYENKKLIVKAHLDALFSIEPIKRESFEALSHLISEYDRNLLQLAKIGEETEGWSTVLAYMVCSRLDSSTLRLWEAHHASKEVPTYDDLIDFLRQQCAVLQSIAPAKPNANEPKNPRFSVSHTTVRSSNRCPFCGGEPHSAFKCQKFLKLKLPERHEMVKRHGLCFNCLSSSHMLRACTRGNCRQCQHKHHTLLHPVRVNSAPVPYNPQVPNRPSNSINQQQQQPQPHAQNTTTPTHQRSSHSSSYPVTLQCNPLHTTDPSIDTHALPVNTYTSLHQVLLSTALVRVTDRHGNFLLARALLDSCSEYCFITTNLYQKLNLVEASSFLTVAGIGGSVVQSNKLVKATILPRDHCISSYVEMIDLHVLPKLTSTLPTQAVSLNQLKIPADLTLADPEFHQPGPIDLIIGAEHYYDLLEDGRRKLNENGPTMQKTVFGWVISGRVPDSISVGPRSAAYPCANVELREIVTRFWELESCFSKSLLSVEESACEEFYDETTYRDADQRYVVSLPKKGYLIDKLGDSRATALRRLEGLERRLARDSALKQQYFEFIQEYIDMGHMIEVKEESNQLAYYMPHHPVQKPDSTTTKLRVVFDASCRTTSGVSLNEALMVGPVVQDDLLSIVLRFRFRKIAIVADIAKMYRMVRMNPADQPLQRILWRFSPEEPVKSYQMTTVTYGTASAPYLATKSLQRLAQDGESSYPAAAAVIKKDVYVDDLMTGTDDPEEGAQLVSAVNTLTNSAGFILRKYCSNSPEILSKIPPELRDERTTLELDSSTATVKTLGLLWEPSSDSFKFAVPVWNSDACVTKRSVLSDIARVFDPLGLIGPVVVQAKIFLQQIWKHKSDWDDPLPDDMKIFWEEYRRNLIALESFSVPRWTGYLNILTSVELHGFCDASEAAYGACIYLRCTSDKGSITVRLVTAKSKVAPLEDLARRKKRQSIPRLELSSALLLAHLYDKLRQSIPFTISAYFWTDSMIVKYWLASLPSRWQSFVGNRVSEIQHITKGGIWNHISGTENPADIISRGMSPAQLQYQSLWLDGPSWLKFDRSAWPTIVEHPSDIDNSMLEEKPAAALPVQAHPPSFIFELHSSLPRLIRIVALLQRFIHNSKKRNRDTKRIGQVSLEEVDEALQALVKLSQRETFPEELKALRTNHDIRTSSPLSSLNPVLVDGTMRVGGRLRHAAMSEDRRHPFILHPKHPLTKTIMRHYHLKNFHAGQQLLVSTVRERFWPIHIDSLARKVIFECVSCFRNKPKVQQQLMADLPPERVNPDFVFNKVGVDLCGPFYIKYPVRKTAPIKCFIAIYVCLVTKAVHMEIVADLSTQSFLASFKRFTAIRSTPKLVMCDNAKNFVGADRELRELKKLFVDQQFQNTIITEAEVDGVDFKFIPPRSPNFGGLWEAAVKSFKRHFRRTIGNNPLTYDELHTVVHQISAILNSRPLTPLSNDPDDYQALTPGHFLVGRPMTAFPEPDLQDLPLNRLSLWQEKEMFVQRIWQRWSTEYLSNLHNRTKWTKKRNNIHVGTMVLIMEENMPKQSWCLGRVINCIPGPDGHVRVVLVKTKDTTLKRGISKICVLPIRDNFDELPSQEH
ncbi:uncharacterized protein LOC129751989 [Uranotaenia lowii]|uniref:uncharacterized protein LOC129751989 n=1 Tax=Uranotaenia lowii TaxID=190385 RepID=UPI00247ABF59|nr:uncharacterized protein LOC129751989 [Uranotaenia lowii]